MSEENHRIWGETWGTAVSSIQHQWELNPKHGSTVIIKMCPVSAPHLQLRPLYCLPHSKILVSLLVSTVPCVRSTSCSLLQPSTTAGGVKYFCDHAVNNRSCQPFLSITSRQVFYLFFVGSDPIDTITHIAYANKKLSDNATQQNDRTLGNTTRAPESQISTSVL